MIIYIASDHGGFKLKQILHEHLKERGYDVEDLGPDSLDPADDYPDYAFAVAQAVAAEADSLGIILCRSSHGVCIVANKVKGIRAASAWNKDVAIAGRRDDHVNILCLASDYEDEKEAKVIVDGWLTARPGQDERYLRRIKKIEAIENHRS